MFSEYQILTIRMMLAFSYTDLEVSFSIGVIYLLISYLREVGFVRVECFSHSVNVLVLDDQMLTAGDLVELHLSV